MAPSSKKIGEEEASNILLNYLATQNRPYAVTDIITNLHGTIGKTLAIKVLTTLAEQGKIFAKTYGKAVIYVVKQDGNAEEENSTKDLTEEENETKAKELEDTVLSLSGEIKKLKSKLKDITSEPTNDELPKLLEDLRTEVSNQNKIIGEISDPNAKQITIEEIEDLKKQKDALQKIYKKRTKVAKDFWTMMRDNVPDAKALEEQLGLEWHTII